jgi:hypothetical protein
MSYPSTVYNVMIASPSDVPREREIIRRVVFDWDFLNAERRHIVLMPVGWETHARPSLKARAQEVINKEVLVDCDLLVAVFWTRLGSPTGAAASGTVEEINEHIAAGKPVMLYFSSAPVALESVDREQYDALLAFKAECEAKGLIERYDSLTDFEEKFRRQLALTVDREFTGAPGPPTPGLAPGFIPIPVVESRAIPTLTQEGRELLLASAESPDGKILYLRVMQGPVIQAGGRTLNETGTARDTARWVGALEELEREGLVRAEGYKREVFSVTREGYDVAEILKQR